MPQSSRSLAIAVLAGALALPAFAPARALAGPLPSSFILPPHVNLRVEPHRPCATDTVTLVVDDSSATCTQLVQLEATASDSARVVFTLAPGADCTTVTTPPQTARLPLGVRPVGANVEFVTCVVRFAGDSTTAAGDQVTQTAVPYLVASECTSPLPPPPPPPSPPSDSLPFVQHVTVVGASVPCDTCPPRVCSGQPVVVNFAGYLPNTCWTFRGARLLPLASAIDRPVVVLEFSDHCYAPCGMVVRPFSGEFSLPSGVAGKHAFDVQVAVNECPDTTLGVVGRRSYPFVTDSCNVTPPTRCAFPFLSPVITSADSTRHCIPPGGTGGVLFGLQTTDVHLAGVQGVIFTSANLHFVRLEAVGPAAGMHVVTHPQADGSTGYALFADAGAPILGKAEDAILRVVVRADSVAPAAITGGTVGGTVTAASDSTGESIPICPIMTFAVVQANVCIGPPASCDVNHDGVIDVADLVRMARCWFHPASCTDSTGGLPDCNGDGASTVGDILCCARTMLGGSPHDTTHVAPGLSVEFGAPTSDGVTVHVPLLVHGAGAMNGALLHLNFPGDRYQFVPPAVPASGAGAAGSSWLTLADPGDDSAVLGILRLDDAAADEITLPLEFTLRTGLQPGGAVTVDLSDVIAPDGSPLAVDLSHTQAAMPSGPTGGAQPVTRVELLCGPNPASGSTRFVVRLPQAGPVDLGIFDLAGRRIETLFRGNLASGETAFTWEPRPLRGGLYFARLSVNGIVRTTRVTMQLAR